MARPEHEQPGLGSHRLDEHLPVAVGQGPILLVAHQLDGVAGDIAHQPVGQRPGEDPTLVIEHRLGPDTGPVDHRGDGAEPLGGDQLTQGGGDVVHHDILPVSRPSRPSSVAGA